MGSSVWVLAVIGLAVGGSAEVASGQANVDFLYDPPDVEVATRVWENPLRYESDVLTVGDTQYFAWLEFVPGRGDQVKLASRAADKPGPATKIATADPDFGDFARPTLSASSDDQLWLSYEKRVGTQWDVFVAEVHLPELRVGEPACLSRPDASDIRHSAVADGRGGVYLAWQSDVGGQFDVALAHHTPRAISQFVVSDSPYNDWHPRLALGPRGMLVVAWDGYNGKDHDVFVRVRQGDASDASAQDRPRLTEGWFPVQRLTDSEAFEGRPDVAFDGRGAAWIAWEVGGSNWGRPYRGLLTPAIGDNIGPLHRFRSIRIGLLDPQGRFRELKQPLPMPSLETAQARHPATSQKSTGVFYERPRLISDSTGHVWIAYRHFYAPWLGYEHRSHIETGWGLYARHYGSEGWSSLYQFSVGQGDGLQRFEWDSSSKGLRALWTTGRTDRRVQDRPRGLVEATVGELPDGEPPSPETLDARQSPALAGQRSWRQRPVWDTQQREYQLLFGDLHRHTDLSLCRVPIDGTIDDAYRYASDVAELDFLGITDHSRDIALGNPLSQLWWRSRKEVQRYQQGTRFLPLFAYERSHGNTADHNVISLRDDVLRPHTYPIPRFWTELDRDSLTIPHQPIRRDTWKYQDDELRPVVEIFQGARDTSIEEHVHRGLAKGYHLGFIASSDHMSTSASYACVWAERSDRESIFRALRARRTYAATAKIQMRVWAGEHLMGEQVERDRLPPLQIDVQGTAPIRSVTVVVNGKPYREFSPNRPDVRLTVPWEAEFPVRSETQTQHYVYVHLVQADGNEAWSSPIWWQAREESP